MTTATTATPKAALWIVGMLALPQPIKNVITAIVAIIVLLWILSTLGIFSF